MDSTSGLNRGQAPTLDHEAVAHPGIPVPVFFYAFSRPWGVTAEAGNRRYSRKTDTGLADYRHEGSFRPELRHDTNSDFR